MTTIAMFIEEQIARDVSAEHNARLRENAFCNNIKMEPPTGELAYRCMKPVDEIELGFCADCLKENPELRDEL